METPDIHIDNLIISHIERTIGADEEKQLLAWVKQSIENERYFVQFKKLHNSLHSPANTIEFDTDAALNICIQEAEIVQKKSRKMYVFSTIAASVMLVFGLWAIFSMNANKVKLAVTTTTFLAKDSIANYTLSDNSIITINKNSHIDVAPFTDSIRFVSLVGSAYFEVAKNPKQAFIIQVGSTKVRVLGTSFEVRQNPTDSSVSVFVVEGKVQVTDSLSNAYFILTANQACTIWRHGKDTSYNLANTNFLAWKTGVLEFKNTALSEVVTELGNFYDKQFVLENNDLGKCKINAKFNNTKFEDVKSVLSIALSGEVEERDSLVYVSAKPCLK
ncbi:MAG: FecR domain-containing protein [Bacteroidales bacterium]|nr:FecR domain-containing protein [Bacteroidales bacterium]